MSDPTANKALIERFWEDLGRRDFAAVRAYFTDDAHYTDVPAPEDGARDRTRSRPGSGSGIEPLERYVPRPGTMTAEADRP